MERNRKKWLMAGILTCLSVSGAASCAAARPHPAQTQTAKIQPAPASAQKSGQESAQAPAERPKACPASWLSLALDPENGTFNGMSHSGTLLVLRNLGPQACTVPALPRLRFEDAHHHPVSVARQAPVGMHPGPVMLPVAVPSGAELTAKLRWVDGDVFSGGSGSGSSSASPAYLLVPIGGKTLRTAFHGQMFGPKGKAPEYTQTPLERDPVWQGDQP